MAKRDNCNIKNSSIIGGAAVFKIVGVGSSPAYSEKKEKKKRGRINKLINI